jgi:hypothetical protein
LIRFYDLGFSLIWTLGIQICSAQKQEGREQEKRSPSRPVCIFDRTSHLTASETYLIDYRMTRQIVAEFRERWLRIVD